MEVAVSYDVSAWHENGIYAGFHGRLAKEMLRNVAEQARPIRRKTQRVDQAIGFNVRTDDDFLERVARRILTDEEFERIKAWNAEKPSDAMRAKMARNARGPVKLSWQEYMQNPLHRWMSRKPKEQP